MIIVSAIQGTKNEKQTAIENIKNISTVKDAKTFIKQEKEKEINEKKLKELRMLRKHTENELLEEPQRKYNLN